MSLVACSGPTSASCEVTAAGSASAKVKVKGDSDAEPKVEIPSPLKAKVTERTVITEGKGEVVQAGMLASINYVVYNAATGEKLGGTQDFSKETAQPVIVDKDQLLVGMAKAIQCSTVGSRVVAVIPPADAFGADGPNVGVGVSDSLVFVFDIRKVEPAPTSSPSSAPVDLPTPAAWTKNLPEVDLSAKVPVVTLPDVEIPTELELAVLKEGDGDLVTSSSTVTFDYQGTSWNTKQIFDQSYTKDGAITFPVTQLVKGFTAAMVGQKVGATLLVTVPPQYGYGEGPVDSATHVGETLVFLIQIRAVA